MLEETLIDSHTVLLFVRNVWNSCKEAVSVLEGFVRHTFAEIHIEGRITHHIVELFHHLSIFAGMAPADERIALHDVGQRMHQIVQNQIKAQHRGALLALVLAVDGAAVFAYLVGQCHQQRARTGRWVATGDAFQLFLFIH